MDTFTGYLPEILATDESRGFANDIVNYADMFGVEDTFSVLMPAFLAFHDIYDTDRARMTGMLT